MVILIVHGRHTNSRMAEQPTGQPPEQPPLGERLKQKLSQDLTTVPSIQGWFVVGYSSVLLIILLAPVLVDFVEPTIEMIAAYSTMTGGLFVVLLGSFVGVYFIVPALIQRNRLRRDDDTSNSAPTGPPAEGAAIGPPTSGVKPSANEVRAAFAAGTCATI